MAGTQQITVLAVPRHHVHNIPLHATDDRQETIIFRELGEIDFQDIIYRATCLQVRLQSFAILAHYVAHYANAWLIYFRSSWKIYKSIVQYIVQYIDPYRIPLLNGLLSFPP